MTARLVLFHAEGLENYAHFISIYIFFLFFIKRFYFVLRIFEHHLAITFYDNDRVDVYNFYFSFVSQEKKKIAYLLKLSNSI